MEQTTIAPLQGSHSPKKAKPRRRLDWLPFWLILPTILVLLAIQVYPALYTVVLSVQEREPAGWEFVGLKNFEILLGSSALGESAGHTLVFLVGYASLTLILAFVIALLLNRKSSLSGFTSPCSSSRGSSPTSSPAWSSGCWSCPTTVSSPASCRNPALFPPKGLSILTADAAKPWFGDFPFPPSPAMIYLILAATWRALPFITLLLLAALQTVSNEVIESSRIDGANSWQTIRHITIPLILPTMVVALFSLTLGGINGVGMVFSLTGGGPGTSTQVLSYLLYSIGWVSLDFGRAAALALMLAVVNLTLIAGTLRITRVQQRSI